MSESIESFFKDEVERAFKAEGLQVVGATGPYLARLLTTYAAQPIEDRPLGVRFLEAVTAAGPRQRRSSLREIGDTSLFLSGYWGDSLGGKLVDVDYYIDLGGMAYAELARDQERAGRDVVGAGAVFSELATHFSRFVEVLMTISRRTTRLRSDRDVVRLYERWLRTKSGWAARRLAEEGVLARATPKGPLH